MKKIHSFLHRWW